MAAVTAPREQPASEMLFRPIRVGPFTLPHRIVMAPLTRSRARTPGNVPTELNACYYAQRASAALIISEATQVSMQGQGYAWTPGIHSREQIEGWRVITDAVHDAGGRMFIQLWHVGRISHPALQPDHMLPVAPSPITPAGKAFIENELGEGELVPFVRPRGLELEELPYVARQYARGARNAQLANADGVEVHGANGYLLEQFLETGTNRRGDAYGGSVAHRARMLLDVVETCIAVWGPERVGVRISPLSTFNDIHDDNPEETFGYIAEQLSEYKLAYLHVINPAAAQLQNGEPIPDRVEKIRRREIRAIAARSLRQAAYNVLVPSGPEDALRLAQFTPEALVANVRTVLDRRGWPRGPADAVPPGSSSLRELEENTSWRLTKDQGRRRSRPAVHSRRRHRRNPRARRRSSRQRRLSKGRPGRRRPR
jgi:N-ethylmaleimide reductase